MCVSLSFIRTSHSSPSFSNSIEQFQIKAIYSSSIPFCWHLKFARFSVTFCNEPCAVAWRTEMELENYVKRCQVAWITLRWSMWKALYVLPINIGYIQFYGQSTWFTRFYGQRDLPDFRVWIWLFVSWLLINCVSVHNIQSQINLKF